jgi:parvulin-like peptidyl-prolyl isomerase
MSDDDAMAVKERIDKIYTELQNGGDFRELADQYGENPTKGDQLVVHPARDDKPLLEEMREVFDSLEDGEVSEPFRTKHGWQVLRRDAYREAGYTPLERVRVTIENAMRNERREEKFMAIMNDLWEDYEGLNINEDVLARAGEEEVADEIIFQVDDYKFTGSQFDQQFGDEITEDTTLEERRALLAKLPTIQQLLVNEDIDDRGLAETEAWENASSRIEDVYLSEVWLREQLATELFEPTEEAISDKFEDSREQLESMPALRLWQITVTPEIEEGMSELEVAEATQQAIDELNAELEKVASRADFESLAKQISEDAFARVGGAIGLKSQRFRDGLGRQLLLSAEENTVAGPFEDPETNEVTAYWVGEKTERGEVTIEEYRAELEQAVTRDLMEEYREEMQESLLEEAGFELLMPEES